jgi:hypothetical protein
MKWNFLTGAEKHRKAMRADAVQWDEELIMHLFGLAIISKSEYDFSTNNHNSEAMNLQILIDGIEVNPVHGFQKILSIIKSIEEESSKQKEFKNELLSFIDKWESENS